MQQDLKILIKDCFYIRNPKFLSEQLLVLAVDMLWRAIEYYIYQRNKKDPKKIHYIKFDLLLIDL